MAVRLRSLADKSRVVRDVRGRGLLWGVECTVEAPQVVAAGHRNGLLTCAAGTDVVRLLPPLTVTLAEVDEIVDRLAQQGLLGFDRDRDRYFYRQLPFLVDAKHQPGRLQGSQELLAKQSVEIEHRERRDGELLASGWVRGESGYYQVALRVDARGYLREGRCSCPWIHQHELRRGPCKHLLALRFAAEQTP